jgi:hypothetical protein
MKVNMNAWDRLLRLIIVLVIAVLLITHVLKGTLMIILGIIAVIFLITSLIGFCPLYTVFKFSTLKRK